MKPYYAEQGITIYHGDCRELLPLISADRCITDPPYGIGIDYPSYVDSVENLASLVPSLYPHLQGFGTTLLTCGIANMWLWPAPKWVMAWFIPGNVSSGPWGFCSWVPILAYGRDPYMQVGQGRRPDAFIRAAAETQPKDGRQMQAFKRAGHPTPKPLSAWKWLVNRGSLAGETIVDPFMGTGVTLEAAKQLGRKAIGIDIDELSCELSAARLSQEVLNFEAGV